MTNSYSGPYPLNIEQTEAIMEAFSEKDIDKATATRFLSLDGAQEAREYLERHQDAAKLEDIKYD